MRSVVAVVSTLVLVLVVLSNPALASTGTGVTSSGTMTFDSAAFNPMIFDLADPPTACPDSVPPSDAMELDLDVTGSDATVAGARFASYDTQLGSSWYRFDMELHAADPSNWPNVGWITGTSPYAVDQFISLAGTITKVSTPPTCAVGSTVCRFFLTLELAGTFAGSLTQPITGTANLDGTVVQVDYTTCNSPFAGLLDTGTVVVDGLVLTF
jgi:hypothetical protein